MKQLRTFASYRVFGDIYDKKNLSFCELRWNSFIKMYTCMINSITSAFKGIKSYIGDSVKLYI